MRMFLSQPRVKKDRCHGVDTPIAVTVDFYYPLRKRSLDGGQITEDIPEESGLGVRSRAPAIFLEDGCPDWNAAQNSMDKIDA